MTAPTPLVMAQHTHRAVDGTRRLTWPGHTKTLRLGQSKQPRTCHTTVEAERNGTDIPATCQVTVRPGLFFLRYQGEFGQTLYHYCAPCAVRVWGPLFGVREVDQ